MNLSKLNKTIVGAVLLVSVVIIGISILLFTPSSLPNGENNESGPESRVVFLRDITVSVSGNGVEQTSYNLTTEQANAFVALTELEQQEPNFSFESETSSSLGEFITTVNGVTVDPNSQYWAIYLNGEPAPVGVSDLILNQGDTLELKLEEF